MVLGMSKLMRNKVKVGPTLNIIQLVLLEKVQEVPKNLIPR